MAAISAELTDAEKLDWIEDRVRAYFDGDELKVARWLSAKNPGLGNIRPATMILNGRIENLYRFVVFSVEEN